MAKRLIDRSSKEEEPAGVRSREARRLEDRVCPLMKGNRPIGLVFEVLANQRELKHTVLKEMKRTCLKMICETIN